MKTSLVLASSLALLLVSGVSSAAVTTYKSTLNGAQETPPVVTAATGSATLTYNDANKKLTGTVTYTGVTATAQHIHQEACGVAGGVVQALNAGAGGVIAVNVTLSGAEETALVAGKLYVNIHSAAHGNGEIRGQLYLDGSGTMCPASNDGGTEGGTGDAGQDSGTSGSSGSSGTSGTSGTSGSSGATSGGTSGSNGATTTPVDAGTSGEVPADDGGGCATSGTESPSNGLAVAGLAGLGLAVILRSRKRTTER
jgi:MYXO-CTERM domain-containing protein